MRIARARAGRAAAQAQWIAGMEPWRSLGYRAVALGTWLGGLGTTHALWVAEERRVVIGLAVVQRGVLLGDFIALLAVRSEAAGRGIGRALLAAIEGETFAKRRWLYTSSDAGNRGAARFYAALGFRRVARLPDMVAPGRDEVLWRKARVRKASQPGERPRSVSR